jgi:hypothetical protein
MLSSPLVDQQSHQRRRRRAFRRRSQRRRLNRLPLLQRVSPRLDPQQRQVPRLLSCQPRRLPSHRLLHPAPHPQRCQPRRQPSHQLLHLALCRASRPLDRPRTNALRQCQLKFGLGRCLRSSAGMLSSRMAHSPLRSALASRVMNSCVCSASLFNFNCDSDVQDFRWLLVGKLACVRIRAP